MDTILIRNADELEVDWTKEPVFEFATEVDALMTLQILGDDLRTAREQVRQIMRYMAAAIPAARNNGEGKTQPQAIINESGLARQTVYNLLGERAEESPSNEEV